MVFKHHGIKIAVHRSDFPNSIRKLVLLLQQCTGPFLIFIVSGEEWIQRSSASSNNGSTHVDHERQCATAVRLQTTENGFFVSKMTNPGMGDNDE